MAAAATALPDYLTNPNAALGDTAHWRYGKAPDYSKTRAVYEKTKSASHEPASLPDLVENLVKNWEVEASFKTDLQDWRTIDHANYSFAINGGTPQTGEHMLEVGTYNAIIAANEYYSPATTDFAASHKTFKRMMPTFAWEVLEVYSGPPHVSFRWRHWGEFKNDYVGFNDKGEKVRVKAHGGPIDVQGVTVATVNDKVQLQKVETWFDPLEMFRQMVKGGSVVTKEPVTVPADVGATELHEATPDSTKDAISSTTIDGTNSIADEEGKDVEAVNVTSDPIEENQVSQTAVTEDSQPSTTQIEEMSTNPGIDPLADVTSPISEPQIDTTATDVKSKSNIHEIRTEVIPPKETLESVQTVAEKELDLDLAEEKGRDGVYQSSGCPFLVTTADQNVLNRE